VRDEVRPGRGVPHPPSRGLRAAVAGHDFDRLWGTATITGVGFFDYQHGQTGVAPNAIELHPVLGFKGACS
jgi:hypothetical protein